jgi:hypothetical protein
LWGWGGCTQWCSPVWCALFRWGVETPGGWD